MANPDALLSQVTDAETKSDYKQVIADIRSYDTGSSPGHDGRTSTDLIDEAEEKLSTEGLSGWSEASINELLKEAIVRVE